MARTLWDVVVAVGHGKVRIYRTTARRDAEKVQRDVVRRHRAHCYIAQARVLDGGYTLQSARVVMQQAKPAVLNAKR